MKAILIAGIFALAGIISLVLSWNLIALVLLITSLIIYFTRSAINVYTPSGSFIKTYSCYFEKERLATLQEIISKPISDNTPLFNLAQQGSGRMDVILSADKEFIGVQLFRFVPHNYEPATEMISYTGADAKKLIKYIEKCRS